MNRIVSHLRANVVAYAALFVALGGTSYAAFALPANSVGPKQIRNHSITPIKLNPGKIAASVRAWALIGPGGHLSAAQPRDARLTGWDPTFAGGTVAWHSLAPTCFAVATGDAGFVWATVIPDGRAHASVHFDAFDTAGHPDPNERVTIAVLCPQR
jgi:hypothetical protein